MVGLREVRGCLESLNALLVRAGSGPNGAQLEVRGTYIAGKSTAFRFDWTSNTSALRLWNE